MTFFTVWNVKDKTKVVSTIFLGYFRPGRVDFKPSFENHSQNEALCVILDKR